MMDISRNATVRPLQGDGCNERTTNESDNSCAGHRARC